MTAAALPATAHASARRSLGIFAVALAALGLSSGSSLVKLAGAPGAVVAFWRLAFGAAIWGVIILVTRTPMPLAVVRRVPRNALDSARVSVQDVQHTVVG